MFLGILALSLVGVVLVSYLLPDLTCFINLAIMIKKKSIQVVGCIVIVMNDISMIQI